MREASKEEADESKKQLISEVDLADYDGQER